MNRGFKKCDNSEATATQSSCSNTARCYDQWRTYLSGNGCKDVIDQPWYSYDGQQTTSYCFAKAEANQCNTNPTIRSLCPASCLTTTECQAQAAVTTAQKAEYERQKKILLTAGCSDDPTYQGGPAPTYDQSSEWLGGCDAAVALGLCGDGVADNAHWSSSGNVIGIGKDSSKSVNVRMLNNRCPVSCLYRPAPIPHAFS